MPVQDSPSRWSSLLVDRGSVAHDNDHLHTPSRSRTPMSFSRSPGPGRNSGILRFRASIRLTLAGTWRLPEDASSPQPIVEKDKETLSSAPPPPTTRPHSPLAAKRMPSIRSGCNVPRKGEQGSRTRRGPRSRGDLGSWNCATASFLGVFYGIMAPCLP